MRRRIFLTSSMAAAPGSSESRAEQSRDKIPRVRILIPVDRDKAKIFDAFGEGLRALGRVEGRNMILEFRL